jgi:beta-lactam-binding protein with PASTA domain
MVAVSCVPASGATFQLGPTLVTCTATDSIGNTATATFIVTVTETAPPACVTVVDVVGLDKEIAKAAITDAELQVGLVTQSKAKDPKQASGAVLSQDPKDPACVAAGTPVDLVYNK